ncbi:DUF371 domain-containing protein [Candidatus Woesearchaeota archaeon]|nr:DUF371 domain-containing protein [Candidatus Woesearchaeota archaeon]
MHFHAKGHPNIKAAHKTTIEFTKADHVTPTGDCIVGIKANYDLDELKHFVQQHENVKITLIVGEINEIIHAKTNPLFGDAHELVIRMGEHASPRTFAIRADKAAKHLNRKMIEQLQKGQEIEVHIAAAE